MGISNKTKQPAFRLFQKSAYFRPFSGVLAGLKKTPFKILSNHAKNSSQRLQNIIHLNRSKIAIFQYFCAKITDWHKPPPIIAVMHKCALSFLCRLTNQKHYALYHSGLDPRILIYYLECKVLCIQAVPLPSRYSQHHYSADT